MAITEKYVNIRFTRTDEYGDSTTSAWWYELPDYLIGTVETGDTVVCKYDGELILGTVEELADVCKYSGRQVLTVVDKVDIKRFEGFLAERERKALLLAQMAERAELKEKLDGFTKAAETDPEMADLLAAYTGAEAVEGPDIEALLADL